MSLAVRPPRNWATFSLRTLFALTTVTALWLGWELHTVREQRVALEWLQSNGVNYSIYGPAIIEYGPPVPSGTCSLETTLDSSARWPAGSTDGEHVVRRLLGTDETMTSIHLPSELANHAARLRRVYPHVVIDVEPASESK